MEATQQSGGRRTRSQVAPDWSTKEALILVNVISAIEGDCLKALSSYQKWKIVVENCSALDVTRTLNQCKSKWNSLLAEYNLIRQWDSKSGDVDSYWSLQCERRKEFGLPINFDHELFKAIDDHVRAQKDQLDTDPDTDPEAEADLLDVIAKLRLKRHRRLIPLESHVEEEPEKCYTTENCQIIHVEDPMQGHVEEEPQKCYTSKSSQMIDSELKPLESYIEEEPQKCYPRKNRKLIHGEEELLESHVEEMPSEFYREENPQTLHAENEPQENRVEEEPRESCKKDKPQKGRVDGKPESSRGRKKTISTEGKEPLLVEKLSKNAELIHAIVAGSFSETADFGAADPNNVEDIRMDFVRREGDKLISQLEDIDGGHRSEIFHGAPCSN